MRRTLSGPHLVDGLTPVTHVMLANANKLNFDRFTVKHGTQNIQNDCHQQLCDSFVSGLGSAPDPTGEFTALPRPSSWFNGIRERRGREGEIKGEEKRKGRGGTGPLFSNFWIRP